MDRLPAGAALVIEPILAGNVVGHGLFRLKPCEIQTMRRRPGPIPEGWDRVPPTLLRYSDEQTVAGVAAVFTALDLGGFEPGRFADWGVVAASRFLGRATLSQTLRDFATEGVWGTSPHLIPHFALHSLSGSISLALRLQGPNLGVGGGLHATAEGFLTALTWLAGGIVPGVWLVLTGWSPELVPAAPGGANQEGSECLALALALMAADTRSDQPLPLVRIRRSGEASRGVLSVPDLPWLAQRLGRTEVASPVTIATDPTGTFRVELVRAEDGRAAHDQDEDRV